jgi:choline dehydrogenase-like flavoprotein
MPAAEFHFIIIGGGTSGLVVATRLTENPNIRVLVLEAGEDHSLDPRVITPALWPSLLGTDFDWALSSEPQVMLLRANLDDDWLTFLQDALNGKKIPISQGRLLGGSSAINGQAFVAPSKLSIDTWGRFGNKGWDWEGLLPYFQKSCTLTKPSAAACDHLGLDYIDEGISSKFCRPIQASFAEEVNDPLPRAWVNTLNNLGYPISGDPFSGEAIGGYNNAMNIHPVTKQRSFAANAYYEPARTRGNLHIITSALVEKIILNGPAGEVTARGVTYTKDGKTHTVTATKDTI